MVLTVGSVLIAIVILSILIFFHELGHFAVGKSLGLPVVEFAVGFGPRIWSVEKKGIIYSLRAFPLGGFCSFMGEDDGSDGPDSFFRHAAWKRALMTIAGPGMNLVVGFVMTMFILVAVGEMVVVPVVDTVVPSSPAAAVGVMPGDRVTAVEGVPMSEAGDIVQAISSRGENPVSITYSRGGSSYDVTIVPYIDKELGRARVGLTFGYERTRIGFAEALAVSGRYCVYVVREMLAAFGNLFKGQGLDDVGGPVGTISLISQSVRSGLDTVLHMVVLLTINLAVFNILPIPALDGGRLVFLGVEMARRRPVNREKEAWVHYMGLIALLLLIAVFTFKDLQRLITG